MCLHQLTRFHFLLVLPDCGFSTQALLPLPTQPHLHRLMHKHYIGGATYLALIFLRSLRTLHLIIWAKVLRLFHVN